MSSLIPSTLGTSQSTLSSLSWKTSPEIFKPNRILSHLYLLHRVLNVVRQLLLKSESTCQNPDVASFMVKYLECASSGKMSSRVFAYHWFLLIALFKSFGSRHSLRLPSSFITGTIELIHSVCSCTSVMMPFVTSLSNARFFLLFISGMHNALRSVGEHCEMVCEFFVRVLHSSRVTFVFYRNCLQ